jgi:hypothetical protein
MAPIPNWLRIAGGVIIVAIIAAVIYQIFILPGVMRGKVTDAENQQTVAEKRQDAAETVRRETEKYYVERRVIEERTQSGIDSVLAANGEVAASDAARRAVCMFNHSYPADHPTCEVQ